MRRFRAKAASVISGINVANMIAQGHLMKIRALEDDSGSEVNPGFRILHLANYRMESSVIDFTFSVLLNSRLLLVGGGCESQNFD